MYIILWKKLAQSAKKKKIYLNLVLIRRKRTDILMYVKNVI